MNAGEDWMQYALEDLALASDKEAKTLRPRHACQHAQQAAEKAIKAALVIEGIGFPKSHDLDDLRDRLPPVWHAATAFPDLAGLTDWAVG